jgi:hypothetical protein
VVTVSISPTAFAAIGATLPEGFKARGRPDGKGGYLVMLDRHVVDRLASMRGRGESYSAEGMRSTERASNTRMLPKSFLSSILGRRFSSNRLI